MQIRTGDNDDLINEIINYYYLYYHLYITGIKLRILNHCHFLFSFLLIRNIFCIQAILLLMILMKLLIFLSV